MPGSTATEPNRTDTRRRLLETAERLFATRGIDAPSLAEITHEAGLHNTGAVHYHFGGREELLAAIVDEHRSRLDARRDALLDELEASGDVSTVGLVRCLVGPMIELLDDERGRAYISISAQRALRPRPAGQARRPLTRRMLRLGGAEEEAEETAPPGLGGFLADLGHLVASSALAQRVQLEEAQGRDAGIGRDAFERELLGAVTRIIEHEGAAR